MSRPSRFTAGMVALIAVVMVMGLGLRRGKPRVDTAPALERVRTLAKPLHRRGREIAPSVRTPPTLPLADGIGGLSPDSRSPPEASTCERTLAGIAALESTHGTLGRRDAELAERSRLWSSPVAERDHGLGPNPRPREPPAPLTLADVVRECLSVDRAHAHFDRLAERVTLPDVFARVWSIATGEVPESARLGVAEARAAVVRFQTRYFGACERWRELDPDTMSLDRAGVPGGALLEVHLESLLRAPRLSPTEQELMYPYDDEWWWRDVLGPVLAFLVGPSLIESPAIRPGGSIASGSVEDHARTATSTLLSTLAARGREDLVRSVSALILHHPDLAFDEDVDDPRPAVTTRARRAAISVGEGAVKFLGSLDPEQRADATPPIFRHVFERKHPSYVRFAHWAFDDHPDGAAAMQDILSDVHAAPGDRARSLWHLGFRMPWESALALTHDPEPLIAAAATWIVGQRMLTPAQLADPATFTLDVRWTDGFTERMELDERLVHEQAVERLTLIARDVVAPVQARLAAISQLFAERPFVAEEEVALFGPLLRDADPVVACEVAQRFAERIPHPPETAYEFWATDTLIEPEVRARVADGYWRHVPGWQCVSARRELERHRATLTDIPADDAGALAEAQRDEARLVEQLERRRADAIDWLERFVLDPQLRSYAAGADIDTALTRLGEPGSLLDVEGPITAAHRAARGRLLLFLGDEHRLR